MAKIKIALAWGFSEFNKFFVTALLFWSGSEVIRFFDLRT